MPARHDSAKSIFLSALEIGSAPERQEYIAVACGEDRQLLDEVQKLLDHQAHADSFLESPAVAAALAATVDGPEEKRLGQQIGAYKIRELIGEGGMGAVYLAEQERPLRRKVALKVIKPGMDSKAVLGRFEAERNALALMNHPNIARVLDAGTTEEGRPYFVMELVNGIPITEYCDDQKLSIRERLQLFVDGCSAIQHAHQKGIIHRDIKPSNVLVTELDGKPIAKVIDFGVAKALNHSLTEHSVYTAFQTVIGTPLYMSPEQASFSAVDVDTRSDVYSLGVLLYELLTGTTPFTSEDLKKVAQEEVFKMIREQEPPRPSNRISSLGGTATRISQLRRTVPDELGRSVSGDLDWIVMKALSKERGRRYKSADYFAEDIGRYLQDHPISARPPSLGYVAGRFMKRNATAVSFAAVVIAMGITLLGVSLRAYFRENSLANKYREYVVQSALMKIMAGDSPENLIFEAKEIQVPEYQILLLHAQKALYNGEPETAIARLKDALAIESESAQGNAMLAIAYYHGGHLLKAVAQREKAVDATRVNSDSHDKLLLAHAMFLESKDALDVIERYLEQNSSPIGLLVRADLQAWHVNYTGNPAGIEEALLDVEAAKRLINPTAFSLAVELWVRTQIIRHDSVHGVDLELNKQLAIAVEGRLARQFPNFIWGNFLRASFWDYQGELEKARLAWESADNWEAIPWCKTSVALVHYRRCEQDQVVETLRTVQSLEDRLLAAPMLLDSEPGRKEALETFGEAEKFALTPDGEIVRNHFLFDVPLLLGDRERARTLANTLLEKSPNKSEKSTWSRLNYELMRLIAGRITPEQLMSLSENQSWDVFSNYYIGLVSLGSDRHNAIKRFRDCHGDGNHYFSSQLADGYLRRIEADPAWPGLVVEAKD